MNEGYGILNISDKYYYEGQFKQNNMDGLGQITYFHSKNVYTGQFRDNLVHGIGLLNMIKANATYIGEFYNGQFHGLGQLIDNESGEITWQGEWN